MAGADPVRMAIASPGVLRIFLEQSTAELEIF